jgi:hypothetical protein
MIKIKNNTDKKIKDYYQDDLIKINVEILPGEIKRFEDNQAMFLINKYHLINLTEIENAPGYYDREIKKFIENKANIFELTIKTPFIVKLWQLFFHSKTKHT